MTSNESFSLQGKTVFVTGAGSGLGAAICKMLVEEGCNVALADINYDKAEQQARDLQTNTLALQVDVGNESQVREALEKTVQHFGSLDAVINNAAIDITVPIDELPVADWER